MARPDRETSKHLSWFEKYYWMGEGRTFQAVALVFKTSPTAVANASKAFGWQARVLERDRRIAAQVSAKADADAVKTKTRQLDIARAVQNNFAARLTKDPSKYNGATKYEPTATDAAAMMRHELLLTGQATDRPEIGAAPGALAALLAGVTEVLRRLLPRCCPACKTELGLRAAVGQELLALSSRLAPPTAAAAIPVAVEAAAAPEAPAGEEPEGA